MPTTRTRRRRHRRHAPIIQKLLAGQPIQRTEDARQELLCIKYFSGYVEYDHPEMPKATAAKLPKLAAAQLAAWDEQEEEK